MMPHKSKHDFSRFIMNRLTIDTITDAVSGPEAIKPLIPVEDHRKASVFVLITNEETPEILFIQKADNPGYPWRNQPAFPGGHVDPYESSLDAAYREIEEELSIPLSDVRHIDSIGFYETIRNTVVEAFAGIWNGKSIIDHDESEISRVVMVRLESLLDIHESNNFSGREPDLHELVYPVKGMEIWGVTARIVHRFLEIIRKYQMNRLSFSEDALK